MFVFLLVIGVTAITLQLTVHKVWERTLREQIERNLKQKALMFASPQGVCFRSRRPTWSG